MASSSPSAEPEALKHSFGYLVNSIDTAALLSVALSRNLITDRQRTGCYNEAELAAAPTWLREFVVFNSFKKL